MPLHEWTDRPGWEGVHHLWITELFRWVKPRLPAGYRAYIGSVPTVAVGAPSTKADLSVRQWPEQTASEPPVANGNGSELEPDVEIAVAMLDPTKALYVATEGRLVSAVELVSPRNKDRPVARTSYLSRYVGYLMEEVHLLLVDLHRRPLGFSFADEIATQLQIEQPPCPAPLAVGYRVGEPAASGGRILAIWRRQLAVAEPLPTMIVPLTVEQSVSIDLEVTYNAAARDAYLS